ncbi:MAG: Transcriptional regulator, PadR family [uncultured Rubrobacteraceae bacterium]|uniref:Transcriptional regulator, PadR family n=1 Tax=uncultured Rubrobacteraceae bacterium TaxID=349277 RepID=A0A6J4R5H7_9ACTN|nr:MAG: Transcriptional regulator, PadR family [uncultured Rubrobacteraceae bacterium]
MARTSTRLLVLGAVREAGAIHGYDLRRELLSWGADEWASVSPGSIYNALNTLVREGMLEVVGTDRRGSRPERTTYRLTAEGEEEFRGLLRDNLRRSSPPNHPLLAGLAFLPFLPRDELAQAMKDRADGLQAQAEERFAKQRAILESPASPSRGGIPRHVAESFRLTAELLQSEAAWARDLAERLEGGELDGLWAADH